MLGGALYIVSVFDFIVRDQLTKSSCAGQSRCGNFFSLHEIGKFSHAEPADVPFGKNEILFRYAGVERLIFPEIVRPVDDMAVAFKAVAFPQKICVRWRQFSLQFFFCLPQQMFHAAALCGLWHFLAAVNPPHDGGNRLQFPGVHAPSSFAFV